MLLFFVSPKVGHLLKIAKHSTRTNLKPSKNSKNLYSSHLHQKHFIFTRTIAVFIIRIFAEKALNHH